MVTLFPPRTQAVLRRLNSCNLPDTCVASIPGTFTEDGEGGGSYGAATTIEFPCRTSPLDARQMETLVSDQLREPGLELLVYEVDEALPVTAALEITSGETGVRRSYEVKGVVPDPTYRHQRRAIIKRTEEAES